MIKLNPIKYVFICLETLDFVQILKGLAQRVEQNAEPESIKQWYHHIVAKRGSFIFKDWLDRLVERIE